MQLTCSDFEHGIQLGKEASNALFRVCYAHALNGKANQIDGGERDVSSSDRCLGSKAVFEDARAAAHGCYFMLVTLRISCFPFFALVERGIQIQEVGEEATGSDFAGQLVKIVVAVFG